MVAFLEGGVDGGLNAIRAQTVGDIFCHMQIPYPAVLMLMKPETGAEILQIHHGLPEAVGVHHRKHFFKTFHLGGKISNGNR